MWFYTDSKSFILILFDNIIIVIRHVLINITPIYFIIFTVYLCLRVCVGVSHPLRVQMTLRSNVSYTPVYHLWNLRCLCMLSLFIKMLLQLSFTFKVETWHCRYSNCKKQYCFYCLYLNKNVRLRIKAGAWEKHLSLIISTI